MGGRIKRTVQRLDALFNLLVGLNLAKPQEPTKSEPFHFIAHSFGAAVTSAAVERLAAFDIPVDQVTYLDPHDFDQGLIIDSAQRLFDIGSPDGYGASVWVVTSSHLAPWCKTHSTRSSMDLMNADRNAWRCFVMTGCQREIMESTAHCSLWRSPARWCTEHVNI